MEEEPWDELGMGALPPDEEGSPYSDEQYSFTRRQRSVDEDFAHDDPDGSYDPGTNYYVADVANEGGDADVNSPQNIREEALKILELAASPTRSSNSVHRTTTGGYAVAPNVPAGGKTRVPAALSGSLFTTSRTDVGSQYRDRATRYAEHNSSSMPTDLEYGDDDAMDAIASVQRSVSDSASNGTSWSSRYSLDRTISAMADTKTSTKIFLENMDRGFSGKSRTSATGLTASSAYDRNSGNNVFGNNNAGFSFRQQNVWGKQGVVVEPNTNLYDAGDQLPAPQSRKSWQEQVQQRKRMQRNLVLGVIAVLVLIITVSTTASKKNKTAAQVPLTMYVTSNVPYTIAASNKFTNDLALIREKADFLVHLGNIQNVTRTYCELPQYLEVSALLMESEIPSFVVPGENDWVNCPDPQKGLQRWTNTFAKFDNNFKHTMHIDYQKNRMENFAFVEDGVLFLSVHVVGGRPTSYDEFQSRMTDNINWVHAMYKVHGDDVRAVVVLGNARPGLPQHNDFFAKLSSFLATTGKPILYVHGNMGNNGVEIHRPFDGYTNMVAVQAPIGGAAPPLPITIGFGEQPFTIGGLNVPYLRV